MEPTTTEPESLNGSPGTVVDGRPGRRFQRRKQDRPLTPSALERPAFLLNPPFSYTAEVANNVWMEEYEQGERVPDHKKAMVQFLELYRYLASDGLVYLLPTPAGCELQDLVFTGNLGIVLEHLPAKDTVVISNFTSEPRRGEAEIGVQFLRGWVTRSTSPPASSKGTPSSSTSMTRYTWAATGSARSARHTSGWRRPSG